ncbi:MAG TPA: single-stranded DNA-binding protein [Bacilli bacterium]|nr:single-stranded DNA-binding protein [Bacilli bacterium]
MNKTFLIGRLTRDPELRYSNNNAAIVNFSIAIDRQYTNQQGKKETDFINIVAFQKQAENIKKYVFKGSLVAVDGRIQTRNYEDKDGKKVYVTEVVADRVQFLDTKGSTLNNNDNVTPADFDRKEMDTVNVADDIYESFGNESIEVSDDDIAF